MIRSVTAFWLVTVLTLAACTKLVTHNGQPPAAPVATSTAPGDPDPGAGDPGVGDPGVGGPVDGGRLAGGAADERVLAGSLHGRTGAYLTVHDAASRVEVRLADLPGLLYRISTPAGSGLAPQVTGPSGRIRLGLRATGDDGPDTVLILLNRSVRWDIRLPAGAGEQRLDLSAGRVVRVDLGSSGLIDLRLPRPEGTVPLVLRGGAGEVTMAGPPVPMRISLRAGAGSVVTRWTSNNGTAAGAILTDPAWPPATHRYTVYAMGGLGSLTVRDRPQPEAG